jgi:hypothetical protein
VEQELPAGFREGQMAEFVENDDVEARQVSAVCVVDFAALSFPQSSR